jgi:hypothetical protein
MRSGLRRVSTVTGAGLLFSLVLGIAPAQAQERVLTVNSLTAGVGDCVDTCSLEEAVAIANDDEGSDTFTIVFADSLNEAPGEPVEVPISDTLTINDDGLTIDGGNDIVIVPVVEFLGEEAIGIHADGVTVVNLTVTGFDQGGVVIHIGATGNTVSRSALYDNSSGNLVLTDDSEEPGNDGQDAPTVGTPNAAGVPVTTPDDGSESQYVDSAVPSYTVEVFRCTEDGEGTEYLATATGVAAGQTADVPVGAIATGDRFSATVTDESTGDTSEFSTCSDGAPEDFPLAGTTECTPGSSCTATTPPGTDDQFTVTASEGATAAHLYAILRGGSEPDCAGYDEQSDDWVQFGFVPPDAGLTRSKTISMQSVEPLEQAAAQALLDASEVCYQALYSFPTKGAQFPLVEAPTGTWTGVLPDCATGAGEEPGGSPAGQPPADAPGVYGPYGPYDGFGPYGPYGPYGPFGPPDTDDAPPAPPVTPTEPETPEATDPCVAERNLVPSGSGWTIELVVLVPAGKPDPKTHR